MNAEKKIKLTDKQKEFITLMRKGWDLGVRGIDNGVTFKRIPANTFEYFRKKKLIEQTDISIFAYQLTELGKTIEL